MKKIIVSLALVTLLFTACKKENTEQPCANLTEQRAVSTLPQFFTQKMLIEMLSSAHCATCPDAEMKFRAIAAAHPNRVFGVAIHDGDAMETPLFNAIDSVFSVPFYASGMLNRTPFGGTLVLPKGNWNANINTCLNKTASCGLKIHTSIAGSNAVVNVCAGFNTALTGDYRLTVYLCEDSVSGAGSGYNQVNYYNTTQNSPFYQMGNPIIGYQHDFVARKTITKNLGEVINPSEIYRGSCIKRSFHVNISGFDANQLYVVAFINKVSNSNMTHEIMNVQQTKLGTTKNWD